MQRLRSWLRQLFWPRPQTDHPSTVALALEILEERLAPAVISPRVAAARAHARWRSVHFAVDDTPASALGVQSSGSFAPQIGLDRAFSAYPYRGNGYSVAVLDTGIDYNHPDLGGGWGKRVIAGYDFVNRDSNPMDDNGHGTHVAGLIGSSDPNYPGVAPGVNLIALKVLDANGSGNFGNVEDALRWVVAHRAQYHIVAVNMSLGAGNYTSNPYTFLKDELTTLKSQGVFVAAAAGNDFYGQGSRPGLAYPAISPYVVSVGAVWAGNFGAVSWGSGAADYSTAVDRICSFSQRSSGLGIMAPGAILTSTYLGGGFQTMAGTSMASPVVAGAAALIHQSLDDHGLYAQANQDYILSVMRATGVQVVDGDDEQDNVANTGMAFRRLDIYAALSTISQIDAPPTLAPIADQVMGSGRMRTIVLQGSDPNGGALTYSARIVDTTSQAYQLRQQLGLRYAGSYFTNQYGAGESWMAGTGSAWYCILPNGELRRWAGSMAATLQPAALVATLDARYAADPSLLWNASPSAPPPPVQISIGGSQLFIVAPAGYVGAFRVEATVSDGRHTATRQFLVHVQKNTAPQIGQAAPLQLFAGQSGTVDLSVSDAENDTLGYGVRILGNYPTPPATFDLSGNRLTVHAAPGFVGSFDVRVDVSDGMTFTSMTFHVTVDAVVTAYSFRGDFNRDGRLDTAEMRSDGSWWVTLAGGAAVQWSQWVPAASWKTVRMGDFNGDGKADIIGFNNDGTWWVGLSTGSRFAMSAWAGWSAGSAWNTVDVGDFNGDGKTDIAGFSNDGTWWIGRSLGGSFSTSAWSGWAPAAAWKAVLLGDFNGDGKTDIAGFSNDGTWWMGTSTGAAFRTAAWQQWSPAASWDDLEVGDFNGDGMTDVIGFSNDGTWWVGRSTGAGLATAAWAGWSPAALWQSVGVSDYNGDGRSDVGGLNGDGSFWVGLSAGNRFTTVRWS